MKDTLVLPAKRVIDKLSVTQDFTEFLEFGEVIIDAVVTVDVFTGTDPSPASMLVSTAVISGSFVTQKIKAGLPGVVYNLVFTATTDEDNILVLVARQAVLIDAMPAGPLLQSFYFTTPPYPIEDYAFIDHYSILGTANTYLVPNDNIDHALGFLAADLFAGLLSYTMLFEAVDHTVALQLGDLPVILISYEIPFEAVDHVTDVEFAFLYSSSISYTTYPDNVDHIVSLQSGSLV